MQKRMKDALPVISVPRHVRSIVFLFRQRKMLMADDIRNFSGSIFPDVFFVAFVKKPVLLMPFSLSLIMRWRNMTARIWFMKKNICLSAEKGNIMDIISIKMQVLT